MGLTEFCPQRFHINISPVITQKNTWEKGHRILSKIMTEFCQNPITTTLDVIPSLSHQLSLPESLWTQRFSVKLRRFFPTRFGPRMTLQRGNQVRSVSCPWPAGILYFAPSSCVGPEYLFFIQSALSRHSVGWVGGK